MPSLPPTTEREVQTSPTPSPVTKEQRGTDTQDLEVKRCGLTVAVQTEEHLVGTGRKKRVEIEAGTAEIKRGKSPLPPGLEWVWLQDPWTREWECLWVPKEEANYWHRREIPLNHPMGVRLKPGSGEGG